MASSISTVPALLACCHVTHPLPLLSPNRHTHQQAPTRPHLFPCPPQSPTNSYQPKRQIPERIDFVYSTLRPLSCKLQLARTPAGHSYSDHLAVCAQLAWPSKAGAPHPATGVASKEGSASELRQQVLYTAAHVLAWGIAANKNSALRRVLMCVSLLLAALVLDSSLLGLLQPAQLATVPGMAALLLANLLLGLGSALCFIMGVVGDTTQAQVLAQARAQLLLQAGGAAKL